MDITKTENYFHSVCLSVCLSVCSQLELKHRKLLILDFLTIVFVLNFSFVIMRQMNEISGELAWAVVLMASINSCFANSGSNRALGKSIRPHMRNICYIYSAYAEYMLHIFRICGIYVIYIPHMGAIYNYIALIASLQALYYRGIWAGKWSEYKWDIYIYIFVPKLCTNLF